LEWTDYSGDALNVKRSGWKGFVNQPKTRASAKPVPVIRQLAKFLNTYRSSTGDPQSGVMFHSGAGQHMDFDKLARQGAYQQSLATIVPTSFRSHVLAQTRPQSRFVEC
jgi:hypothetical protein